MIITFCYTFLKMPIPQLWAVLFFLMLLLLGITSQVGALEGFIAPFYDLKLVHMRKELFTGNNKLTKSCSSLASRKYVLFDGKLY